MSKRQWNKWMMGFSILCLLAPWTAGAEEGQDQPTRHLGQIVVTGTKTPHMLKDTPVETIVLDREDIAKTNAQNVMDVLNNIPGVNATMHDDAFGTYTWNARMRGLSFNNGYALILIDGQRVLGAGQSGGMGEYGTGLNQIPVEMIERIEVVKGPGSALYGSDAMAGVVNIITRRSPKEAVGGAGVAYGWYTIRDRVNNGVVDEAADKDRHQSQAYAYFGDRPWERWGYLFQYVQENAQGIGDTRIDSNRHSFMAKVDADLSERTELFVKGEVSDYETEESQKEKSHRLSAGIDWRPGDNHFFSLKGYTYNWDFNHGFVDMSYGHKYGDVGFHQVEGQYTWRANQTHTVTAGAELQRQGIEYLMDNLDGSRVTVKEDVDVWSTYFQDEISLLNGRVSLVPGVRYDDHSSFGSEINPKLSLMYRLLEATTLRASVGRSFKSPTIRQLYYDVPYRHGNYYALSNPGLAPETAIGYSVGLEQWLMKNSLMFSVGYFRNDIEDMVVSEDTGQLFEGLPLQTYRNVERAQIQGLELLSKFWFSREAALGLSYTYTDSENKENGQDLTYTPEHQFSLTPSYELQEYAVGMSATIAYNSKQYTNTNNTSQLDEYTVVDAKVYKGLGKTAKLSLEADNIFDSDKGNETSFRVGQTFTLKLDLTF